MSAYNLIVVGGGPAGSSAAWKAATSGARVLLVDRARFPRDKPCGDGLTPRAVRSFADIGLTFDGAHRIDGMRVFGAGRALEMTWPLADGFPRHGHVIPRTILDETALRHAASAGADVREGAAVSGPLVEDGVVRGVRLGSSQVRAPAVIAADGASSRLCRAVGMTRLDGRPLGIAVRAQFESARPDDTFIESYLEMRDGADALPGYGWVFPMGGGRVNVGVGLLSTYDAWRGVNTAHVMGAFLRMLPAFWRVPSLDELRADGLLKGWRLPMGFAVWPPWRPGLLAVGDAAGAVNPFNGEGISEAVETGVAGAEVALASLGAGGPQDLSGYEARLEALFGPYYRLGRTFARLIGKPRVMRAATVVGMRVPPVMSFAFKVLANLHRERGGSVGDATMRGLLRLARAVRVG